MGLFVFATGIVALFELGLGLSPVAAWLLGARIEPGTLANAVLVGGFVQPLSSLGGAEPAGAPLQGRVGLLVAGLWDRDTRELEGGEEGGSASRLVDEGCALSSRQQKEEAR